MSTLDVIVDLLDNLHSDVKPPELSTSANNDVASTKLIEKLHNYEAAREALAEEVKKHVDEDRQENDLAIKLRNLALQHPSATTSILDLLMEQGKAYGQTPDGEALKESLKANQAVHNLHKILTLLIPSFDDRPKEHLISSYTEHLLRLAGSKDFVKELRRYEDG
jgi:hypothetical protein